VAVCAASRAPAAAQPAGKEPIVLIAGVSNPKGDIFSNAMDKFAELVAAKTNGEATVRVA
jgi:TRAP-type C4-dicarboxylate transport system substrate-binding protein